MLEKIAAILKVPVETIKNFDESIALHIISNTFTSTDTSTLNAINYYPTFNPIDKIVTLYDEKIALFERMLKDKDGMIEELKKLIKK